MNCMKCGREMAVGQVFCKDCLAYMELHPVKVDTPVVLPNRSQMTGSRRTAHSRKARKPEELIMRQRRLLVIETLLLLIVLLVLAGTIYFMGKQIEENKTAVLPGQNYSTIETTGNS